MKTRTKFSNVGFIVLLTVFVLVCIHLMSTLIAAKVDDVEETITGIVVAVNWDENDEVTEVAIRVMTLTEETEGEESDGKIEDYLVAKNKKGKELLGLVDEEVEATGTVTTDEDDLKTINITSYQVVELDEPEEEDDIN